MKKLALFAVVLLLAGFAASPGVAQAGPPPGPPAGGPIARGFFEFMGAGRGWSKTVVGAPFSAQAVTETKQTLSNGNIIDRQETSTIYRDSEGRTRVDRTLKMIGPWTSSGTPPEITSIRDPVAGFNYILNPAKKTAVKMPIPPARTRPMRHPANGQGQTAWQRSTQSLGNKVINGVEAEGTQTTVTIPAGSIGNQEAITVVSQRWYSPELQIDVMTERNDPRFGDTTYQLTNIQQTEPSPSLFQVPSDYTL
ncbi:MAG: hypothetical protein ACRD19_00425, partial [Terriglobia bacterium]